MSSNLSRRSFLKVMAAGAASVAAAGAVGLPVLDSAKAEAAAEPQFTGVQQASSSILNPHRRGRGV